MSEQSTTTPEQPAEQPAEQAAGQAAGQVWGGTRTAREVNDTVRYAMYSVFAVTEPLPDDRGELAA